MTKLRLGDGTSEVPPLGPVLEGGVLEELGTLGISRAPKVRHSPRSVKTTRADAR